VKKTILLPIEVACRELPGKLLLAHKFASNDCLVYVGSKASVFEFSQYVPGAVYFDKGYHRNVSESIYDVLDQRKIEIVSLDEENAVDFSDFQQLNLRFPDYILDRFRLIFLWGDKQLSYLKNNRANLSLDKTLVTGHPRFELLSEAFRTLYQKDVDGYKQKYGHFVLVNTNFGLGNNTRGDEFVVQNYGSRFPQIRSLIKYQKAQAFNFIDLCKRLSSELDCRIIVRPHPEESITTYIDNLKHCGNVDVISEGSVIPWIIAADVMIHHDCTTAIECAMLGKNSIAYTKDLNRDLVTDIPLKISYQYSDEGDIVKHIKSYDKVALKIDDNILNDYFSFNASGVDKILKETLGLASPTLIRKRDLTQYRLMSNLKMSARRVFGKYDELQQRKLDGLDLDNISGLLKKYNDIYADSVQVEKINDRLFKIGY
jgi:surface carbohydrate biosynthesis protein